MKKIFATLFVAIMLSLAVIPVLEVDGATQSTARWSDATLIHVSAECTNWVEIKGNVWVYEYGYDNAMKDFINNYRTAAAPVKQISYLEYGKDYDIYYLANTYVPWDCLSIITAERSVLSPYTYDINVDEKSQITITVDKIVTSGMNYVRIYDVTSTGKNYVADLYKGESAKLGYIGSGHHYSLSSTIYGGDYLFYEVQITLDKKTFTGSPALYIGLSTVVVILVGVTMFLCGRKPKL